MQIGMQVNYGKNYAFTGVIIKEILDDEQKAFVHIREFIIRDNDNGRTYVVTENEMQLL